MQRNRVFLIFTDKFVPDNFVHDSYEFVRAKICLFISKSWTNLSWTNQEHSISPDLSGSHLASSTVFTIVLFFKPLTNEYLKNNEDSTNQDLFVKEDFTSKKPSLTYSNYYSAIAKFLSPMKF